MVSWLSLFFYFDSYELYIIPISRLQNAVGHWGIFLQIFVFRTCLLSPEDRVSALKPKGPQSCHVLQNILYWLNRFFQTSEEHRVQWELNSFVKFWFLGNIKISMNILALPKHSPSIFFLHTSNNIDWVPTVCYWLGCIYEWSIYFGPQIPWQNNLRNTVLKHLEIFFPMETNQDY